MTTDSALRELIKRKIDLWRIGGGDTDPGGRSENERHYNAGAQDQRLTCANALESILTAAGEAQPKPVRHSCETDMPSECPGCNADVAKPAPAGMVLVPDERLPDDGNGDDDVYNAGWNACRAAMLAITPPPTLNEAFDQVGAAMIREVRGEGAPAALGAEPVCSNCRGKGYTDGYGADGSYDAVPCSDCPSAAAPAVVVDEARWHGSLTAYPWAIHDESDGQGFAVIVGQWAEDGVPFRMTLPRQLAAHLVATQNNAFALAAALNQGHGHES